MTVLDRLDQLLRERPLTRRGVESALGLPLREDVASNHPNLQIFRSFRAAPPVSKVELRLPAAKAGGPLGGRGFRSDAFVVLHVDARAEPVPEDEVRARFGALAPFGGATRPGAPRYLRATTRRGPILFGYAPDDELRLREIIVDAV